MMEEEQGLAIGGKALDYEDLPGIDGKSYSMSTFHDRELLVVVFFGNGCPTCKAAEERLISIQEDYGTKGVRVLLVNSNNSSLSPPDTFVAMQKRAAEIHYNFPYLKDEDRSLARSFGANTTPHAFILDRERKLRYRGRIDNARQASRVTIQDVRNALDDLLSGGKVRVAETESFGCGIVW